MKKIITSLLAVGATSAALVGVTGTPAQASNPVHLTKVYVNPAGPDTLTNAKLNAEYTVIKNTGSTAKTLTGWTLRDKSGHVYKFGTFKLGAGKSVTVHNGRGTNTASSRYWGSRAFIWNNGGDTAILRTASGSTADTCSWGSVSSYKVC